MRTLGDLRDRLPRGILSGMDSKKKIAPIFQAVGSNGPGSSPSTPVYIGDREPSEATYSLMQYDGQNISVVTPETIEEIILMMDPEQVNWINVNGLGNVESVKRLCASFHLNALTVEDILNTEHRPKIEDFGDYLFAITKIPGQAPDGSVDYEQVAFALTDTALITFQEANGDCFGPVRERLKAGTGRLRKAGCDYLLYALFDVIVDNYFSVLERLGAKLEKFEESSATERDTTAFMSGLQAARADLNRMRRMLWPIRDAVASILHGESPLMSEGLTPFLRDLHENAIQAIEVLEFYRETAAGIQEVFLSNLSNRMNEVMKVLTIISTIFIPLTFIAGVYGMNFKYIPELSAPLGYPIFWGAMVAIAVGLIAFFKRKKWL